MRQVWEKREERKDSAGGDVWWRRFLFSRGFLLFSFHFSSSFLSTYKSFAWQWSAIEQQLHSDIYW